MHRFFVPKSALKDGRALLPERAAEQLRRVLRAQPGVEIAVFDGSGAEWLVQLDIVSAREVSGVIRSAVTPAVEPSVAVTLCQALVRPERFEIVLQKCTELGVVEFIPVLSERVQAGDAAPSAARLSRWSRIIEEAAEQSGRTRVPVVSEPFPLGDAVRRQAGRGPVVLLWEMQTGPGLRQVLRGVAELGLPERLSLVVGPVGGFGEAEVKDAADAGALVAGMGPRVLRTETAAIAALSATMYDFGLLGG